MFRYFNVKLLFSTGGLLMFIPYLKYCCSIILILAISDSAFAQVYKWVDDEGQTHFSQTPPADYDAYVIKTRPSPKVDPAQSQQAVDSMIEQQASDELLQQKNKQQQQQQAEKAEAQSKKCDIAKNNLEKYQNNPNGRIRNADGEYTRIDETDRQAKMDQLKQDIKKYCS
jgi:hypothetical protein